MHFDDRLATVLRHRATGDRAARTQFRQLLDLLGNRRHGRDESLLAAAWLRLAALGESIPANERAEMIREPSFRFRNPELAMHLATDEPEVAAAALSVARLDAEDWAALIPRLPVRARGFMRLRRDLPESVRDLLERLGIRDRGLPMPPIVVHDEAEESVPAATPIDPLGERRSMRARPRPANDAEEFEPVGEDSAIGELVKRIEAFRRSRSEPRNDDPQLPFGDAADEARPSISAFAFTTDNEGRINWAEPDIAPMVVGTRLEAAFASARGHSQPIRQAAVTLEGAAAIGGDWIVDAAPRFTDQGGHFQGYAGKFRRPASRDDSDPADRSGETDRVRQLLHELRTPVNAIQGFAEVIQQQLFGPTPHEYRALAAGIASDAARMLAGFDELDRLAKLEAGAIEIEEGDTDFGRIVAALVDQLNEILKPRTAGFELGLPPGGLAVPIARPDAESLAWRLLATLTGAVGAGEQLAIGIETNEGGLAIRCDLPASLAAKGEVFATGGRTGGAVSASMFGAGFALRLARAEARAAGGDLRREDDCLLLTLPLLTASSAEPSQRQNFGRG